eukprot:418120-Rhodomonas_salina.1
MLETWVWGQVPEELLTEIEAKLVVEESSSLSGPPLQDCKVPGHPSRQQLTCPRPHSPPV